MAEKPRLKETDEILSSIGKRKDLAERQSAVLPGGDLSQQPAPRRRARAPKKQPTLPPAVEEDRNPLDISKYALPAQPARRIDSLPPTAEPLEPQQEQPELQQEPPVPQPVFNPIIPSEQVQANDYAFEDFEAERREKERLLAERRAQLEREEEEARHKLLEDAHYREDVLNHLSSQFEEQFSHKFEDREQPEEQAPPWLRERAQKPRHTAPPEAQPQPQRPQQHPQPPIDPVLEQEAEREAESFLQMFVQGVQEEENALQEDVDFRETLAEKFMRERERYLRELGIAEQMEAERLQQQAEAAAAAAAEAPASPPRRKLDFQIQPEMHMRQEDAPPEPARPVTYTRAAQVQVQQPAQELFQIPVPPLNPSETPLAPPPPRSSPQPPAAGGKKSAEELLLELGKQNSRRAQQKQTLQKPAQFQFRFTPVRDPETSSARGKRGERSPRRPVSRAVIISATASLLVFSLVVWGALSALNPAPEPLPEDMVSTAGELENKVLYENFNPDTMKKLGDVTIKRTGLTLSNITANTLVVEEEASSEGGFSLNNVIVADFIYIRSSGTHSLDLQDVQARKLIISNDRSPITIRTGGSTDIETVELRTPGAVEGVELIGDSPGVRSVTLKNAAGEPLHFRAKNVAFQLVSTEGRAEIAFDNAKAQNLSATASLSLTGTGRVETLSAGQSTGLGAGDVLPADSLSLLVKGVEVGHLNLKSSADISLATYVDSLAAADSISLTGSGSIGSLMLNEQFGNSRLGVDVAGLNIQLLTTNAEAVVHSSGSSVINTLVANQSTYALGNKVNRLVANANGVIYENEPDSTQIATGISPPQSKADNPNLNYAVGAPQRTPAPGEADNGVFTTCDHAREVGGFVQGDGSKDNPFMVQTAAQLAHVGQHAASHFVQAGDIDIAEDSSFSGGFAMIGAAGERFAGTYDGAGYAVRNLRIYSEGESVGLFAENTGTIRNLHLATGEVNATGKAFVGGLVGMNYQGGVVVACSSGVSVKTDSGSYAGGLVGYNYGGKVRDCYNTGKVSGGDATGGIVGMNRQNASVTGCYNIGTVESGDTGNTGAVAGVNEAVVTNCYYLDDEDIAGIGLGEGNAVAKDSDQLVEIAADLAGGNDDSLWQPSSGGAYAYPTLRPPTGLPTASLPEESAADTQASQPE